MRSLTVVASALFVFSCFHLPLTAQTRSAGEPISRTSLNIDVLEGENAQNNVGDLTSHEPVVQVSDENHKPVRGAAVSFAAVSGDAGAGATFGAEPVYSTVTDADGKAIARGFEPNQIAGKYRIQVNATKSGRSATTMIHETNLVEAAAVAGSAGGAGAFGAFLSSNAPNFLLAGAATAGGATGLFQAFKGSEGAVVTSTPAIPATPASVPEIDPSMAFGCLVLLAGSTAVLRGR